LAQFEFGAFLVTSSQQGCAQLNARYRIPGSGTHSILEKDDRQPRFSFGERLLGICKKLIDSRRPCRARVFLRVRRRRNICRRMRGSEQAKRQQSSNKDEAPLCLEV